MKFLTLFLSLLALSPMATMKASTNSTAASSEISWTSDFEAAKALASKESKPLFVFFTGSDWCPWCKRIDEEILSTPEFQQAVAGKMIFVKIDFPKYTKLDADTQKQNRALSKTYGVKGFPTVILLDSQLNTISTLHHEKGGGQAYAKKVLGLLDAKK